MYIPLLESIPDTKENSLGVFTSQQLYGPGFSSENKNEVYGPRDAMTADTINFIRVKTLFGDKQEYIASIKSGLILDGGMRIRYPDGTMVICTMVYPRNGKKNTHDRLYKHKDGRCDYDELIQENDEWKYTLEWKTTLSFRFNESSLTWTKLNVLTHLFHSRLFQAAKFKK